MHELAVTEYVFNLVKKQADANSVSHVDTIHLLIGDQCDYVPEIIEEYLEILQKLTDEQTATLVIKTIVESPFTEFITPYYQFHLITSDPDDNKFVDCAIAATARYVVTNDHHYDVLRIKNTFPTVEVINLKDFLALIKK